MLNPIIPHCRITDVAMKNVLFIEDDPSRCELIRTVFAKKSNNLSLQFVPSRSEALHAAEKNRPGVVFLKTEPGDLRAFVKALARATPPVLPVLVTNQLDEQSVLQALKEGIMECVGADPSSISEFPAVAERAVARYQVLLAAASHPPRNPAGTERRSGDAGAEIGRLKEMLYRSSAAAAVGSLVSGIVHEINNPLTGTLAYTELLAMKVSDESVKEDLKKILQSAERCKKAVDNLLAFSRLRTTAKSIGSINSIIEQTIDLRRYALRSENIEIATELHAEGAIFAHAQQIQQALLYILLNSEEAAASSGRTPRRIAFITRESTRDRTITLEIADTGAGFDPDIVSRIFDPFFTTKPGKCGLGLALARDIITNHGGTIQAENNKEGGALITIVLPTGA